MLEGLRRQEDRARRTRAPYGAERRWSLRRGRSCQPAKGLRSVGSQWRAWNRRGLDGSCPATAHVQEMGKGCIEMGGVRPPRLRGVQLHQRIGVVESLARDAGWALGCPGDSAPSSGWEEEGSSFQGWAEGVDAATGQCVCLKLQPMSVSPDELGARGGNETTRGITTVFAQLGTVRRGCQFSS